MSAVSCLLSPATCVASTVAKSTLGGLFTALTKWILDSVHWFLTTVGQVLTSASEPATIIRSSGLEFDALLKLAPGLMMLGLMVATMQALRHGDGASLWRVYLVVAPACVFAIAVARPVATLVLEAVNQLSSGAAATVVQHESTLTSAVTGLAPTTPGFGLFLMAIGVVIGTWLLWCELIVRGVVLTLLLVLVPLIVPLSTFPAGRRLGWRLAETFLAVAVSKLLIVVTLSLGLNELTGSSSTEVITGAVTLLLATASPFLLLRIIPFIEQSAVHNLEGVRARFTSAVTNAPSSPVGTAVRALMPDVDVPGPPTRPDDLGFAMWEGTAPSPMPEEEGEQLPAPIGVATPRKGHVAYHLDDMGPVVGWHFDD